ncbi:hypothetical protein R31_131 [Klebsiella phage R3_1]|nr:hypothetical protein R31_131 [Klebsiella phage R3_1]
MAYSGRFTPENVSKYRGDIRKITYRSSWEKFFMSYLDRNPKVVKWASEETVIPYFCNAEGKKRRYFMDFWFQDINGQQFFIEVKPKKETAPPQKPSKLTAAAKKRYINEVYTWSVNVDKWKAAQKTADKMGITFRILTEEGLRKLGFKGC